MYFSAQRTSNGVVDTVPIDEPLASKDDDLPIVISYVGYNTPIMDVAKKECESRMVSGQIAYAIFVFRRGRRGVGSNKNSFVDPGSKAWINQHIEVPEGGAIFVDDGRDHIMSTKSLKIYGLRCIHVKKNSYKQWINLIKN